jgi:hypothetical protein
MEDVPAWPRFISRVLPSSMGVRPKVGLARKINNANNNKHTFLSSFSLILSHRCLYVFALSVGALADLQNS